MDREFLRYVQRLFAHHADKMRNIIARGVVSMVEDGPRLQTNQIKVLSGETIDGAERVQQYGFTSHPQVGAECYVAFCGADRAHALVFSVDDRRFRVRSGKPGEVVIYTDEGDQIALKRDNTIEVTTKHFIVRAEEDVLIETKEMRLRGSTRISLETPNLAMGGYDDGTRAVARFNGDLEQDGYHESTGDQIAAGVSQIHHPHSDAGGTGNSGPPIAGA